MTMENNVTNYEKGLQLAEQGRHGEALEYIGEFLRTSPDNAQALNDAGAILHCLGRTDEALDHFLRARDLLKDSPEIAWNLVEAYLGAGRPADAMGLFDEMQNMHTLNTDVLNRTANVFLNQNNKAGAIEAMIRSIHLSPQQEVLEPMIEVIRGKRPKVAFFCGGDGMTFLNEITEFVKKRFEVRIFEGQTEEDMRELMQWSDISWFEWCTNLAAAASNMPKLCKNIIRLHRYEAYGTWPMQVNWNNIDVLITVGNKVTTDTLLKRIPSLESQTSMVTVPNGINLEKFSLNHRPRGKNIAFLANLRMVKNPGFLLQCMQKLNYIDSEYRLYIAGVFQDLVLEQYVKHMVKELKLENVVFFDGYQSNVASWLADKDFIVSSSICEGHPVGILEAMACGLKPVIHNFIGAENIFPSQFLFNIAEEFCQQILSDDYSPEKYRSFVEHKYSLKDQLRRINDIFISLEKEIDSQPQVSTSNISMPTFM